jgi:hypothetical protein
VSIQDTVSLLVPEILVQTEGPYRVALLTRLLFFHCHVQRLPPLSRRESRYSPFFVPYGCSCPSEWLRPNVAQGISTMEAYGSQVKGSRKLGNSGTKVKARRVCSSSVQILNFPEVLTDFFSSSHLAGQTIIMQSTTAHSH